MSCSNVVYIKSSVKIVSYLQFKKINIISHFSYGRGVLLSPGCIYRFYYTRVFFDLFFNFGAFADTFLVENQSGEYKKINTNIFSNLYYIIKIIVS